MLLVEFGHSFGCVEESIKIFLKVNRVLGYVVQNGEICVSKGRFGTPGSL